MLVPWDGMYTAHTPAFSPEYALLFPNMVAHDHGPIRLKRG